MQLAESLITSFKLPQRQECEAPVGETEVLMELGRINAWEVFGSPFLLDPYTAGGLVDEMCQSKSQVYCSLSNNYSGFSLLQCMDD